MALDSMQEILERMEAENKPFWQVVQDTDREERQVTAEASREKMRATWQAMLESVTSYQGERMSLSGLVGGDGERMRRYAREGTPLSGAYRSSPRHCAWESPTPACARLWRLPRQAPAACCRRSF